MTDYAKIMHKRFVQTLDVMSRPLFVPAKFGKYRVVYTKGQEFRQRLDIRERSVVCLAKHDLDPKDRVCHPNGVAELLNSAPSADEIEVDFEDAHATFTEFWVSGREWKVMIISWICEMDAWARHLKPLTVEMCRDNPLAAAHIAVLDNACLYEMSPREDEHALDMKIRLCRLSRFRTSAAALGEMIEDAVALPGASVFANAQNHWREMLEEAEKHETQVNDAVDNRHEPTAADQITEAIGKVVEEIHHQPQLLVDGLHSIWQQLDKVTDVLDSVSSAISGGFDEIGEALCDMKPKEEPLSNPPKKRRTSAPKE